MGFDYFASHCDTIHPDVIERVAPAAWAAFQQVVTQVAYSSDRSVDTVLADVGREEEHNDHDYDSDDEIYAATIALAVIPALERLRQAFQAATSGIGLHIGWVDGDTLRGSDLRGEVFWYITGHRQPTPAYLAFAATYGEAITKTWITGG